MAANPNPAHISAAMWRFVEACLALGGKDTVNAGTFGDKPGYHNSRAELLRDRLYDDYSIQLPDDKLGPDEYGAAFDWTFRSAQAGDFAHIAKFGGRIARAWRMRDPRLRGWREVLIQADMDSPPEGFDFVGWYTRTPDNTHRWHGHFSILRRYINHWPTYAGMLQILEGKGHAEMLGLRKGDEGLEVEFLQTMLKSSGFYEGAVDGKYGAVTSASVLALRKSVGSAATSGDVISRDACEQIYRVHAMKRAGGEPGPVGPEGPQGPPGPPGPAIGSVVTIAGTVTVTP